MAAILLREEESCNSLMKSLFHSAFFSIFVDSYSSDNKVVNNYISWPVFDNGKAESLGSVVQSEGNSFPNLLMFSWKFCRSELTQYRPGKI